MIRFLRPASWPEALEMKAAHPEALPIAGGTDVMVEINLDHRRPDAILDLTRVGELTEWGEEDGQLRVGAGVTYTRLIDELGDRLPGLAIAARTVGSPQIRNRGTVGGNLGTASPAGDAHPVLLATDATVELASTSGTRRVAAREFFVGPKRNAMRKDELIAAFLMEPARGPQQFSKVGTRNAMVIAVCALALTLDPEHHRVGAGIGSAGPTPIYPAEACTFIEGVLDEQRLWEQRREVHYSALTKFAELLVNAARPIDDVRGTADYRRHALWVLARRTFMWAWDEYRTGGRT